MKILIIEDDSGVRHTLQDILELSGHSVLAAANGKEGIMLAEKSPDFIFCDISMPGMDGYQVIETIQKMPTIRDVPFVFLSAKSEREDQRRGMNLGADDYITKPFTVREILDAIKARTRRQSTIRQRFDQLVEQRRHEIGAEWSHELLTPLTGILGGLELIETDVGTIDPEGLKTTLSLIRESARRQEKLSRKLILFFELERLKYRSSSAPLSWCEIPAAAQKGASRAAAEENRTGDLSVSCEPGLASVEKDHLCDAIAEVVGNAFRFSPPGQPVVVTGKQHGGRYLLEIVDNGMGMSDEQRSSIVPFTQFQRTEREQQGLGLGLSIARSVAFLAGGRLVLEPGPQKHGLKAIFDLPVASPQSATPWA